MIGRVCAGLAAAAVLSLGIFLVKGQSVPSAPGRVGSAAPQLEAGKQAYAHWCAPCHAAEPGLAGTLALQTKYKGSIPAALEDRTDLTPEVVAYFVRNGVAWMAPFRKTEISDAELAQIGAYLSAPLRQRGAHAELLVDEMMRSQDKSQ